MLAKNSWPQTAAVTLVRSLRRESTLSVTVQMVGGGQDRKAKGQFLTNLKPAWPFRRKIVEDRLQYEQTKKDPNKTQYSSS